MRKYFAESYGYVQLMKLKSTKKAAMVKTSNRAQGKVLPEKKSNINPKVADFIVKKNIPLANAILRIREIILQNHYLS